MLDDDRIEEIKRLRAGITSLPWVDLPHPEWLGAEHLIGLRSASWSQAVFSHVARVSMSSDAAFIAAAPTIRTVMVRMDFVEASQSREAAKKDVTRDEAKRIEESRKGKTTDGASDVAITESARRRQDLLPGSGHHGLIYSMAVSVTGRNEDDALRAGTRVEQAADNCGIGEIVWQDNRHDVAAFLTLPLGRGLAATKWTRIKTRG